MALNTRDSMVLSEAIRMPVIESLRDMPMVLTRFVELIDEESAEILVRVGYVNVNVLHRYRETIEYVSLTDKGRRALGFVLYGCPA